jgi:Ulp1 family protease
MLELSFKQTQRDMTRNRRGASQKEKGSEEYQAMKFDLANDLREVKFYLAGDTSDNEEASVKSSDDSESMSFLAMKVDISKSSSFRYPNHYKPNGRDLPKGYILVEFRSDTEFTELLQIVEGIRSLSPYFDKQAQLTTKTAESYCKPFIKDSNNERTMSRNSMGSPTSRSKQGFLAGRKEEDILLVYPFDGDDELIEKSAKGLNEASTGDSYNADSSPEKAVVEAMEIDNADLEVSDEGKASIGRSDKGEAEPETKTRGRAHFLTVRVEDYDRLEPGEFLNDTLIDFWMQWYVPIEHAPMKARNVNLTLAQSFLPGYHAMMMGRWSTFSRRISIPRLSRTVPAV